VHATRQHQFLFTTYVLSWCLPFSRSSSFKTSSLYAQPRTDTMRDGPCPRMRHICIEALQHLPCSGRQVPREHVPRLEGQILAAIHPQASSSRFPRERPFYKRARSIWKHPLGQDNNSKFKVCMRSQKYRFALELIATYLCSQQPVPTQPGRFVSQRSRLQKHLRPCHHNRFAR
jgi:hypothetical protein